MRDGGERCEDARRELPPESAERRRAARLAWERRQRMNDRAQDEAVAKIRAQVRREARPAVTW